jgi:hypothetical protein
MHGSACPSERAHHHWWKQQRGKFWGHWAAWPHHLWLCRLQKQASIGWDATLPLSSGVTRTTSPHQSTDGLSNLLLPLTKRKCSETSSVQTVQCFPLDLFRFPFAAGRWNGDFACMAHTKTTASQVRSAHLASGRAEENGGHRSWRSLFCTSRLR